MAASEAITRRRSYSLDFKLGVLEWMASNKESVRGTARKFGIHRRMIQRWKEREPEISMVREHNGTYRKKIHVHNQLLYQNLEERLLDWFNTQRESSKVISNSEIKSCALAIAQEIGLHSFKASPAWILSFRERHDTLNPTTNTTCKKYSSLNDTSSDRILWSSSSFDSSFLTLIHPTESIKLLDRPLCDYKDMTSSFPSEHYENNNHVFVYYDYQSPEHNYCKVMDELPPSTNAVYTIRLSERIVDRRRDESLTSPILVQEDMTDQQIITTTTMRQYHQGAVGEMVECVSSPQTVLSSASPFLPSITHTVPSSSSLATPTSPSAASLDIDGVLKIASRTYQPEFNDIVGPELVYNFSQ